MQVRDLMSHPAVTCPTSATLDHVARLMWESDCGVIPVVNDRGHLSGVVTDRDICMAAYTQGTRLRDIPVTTAMATNVIALRGDETVESAAQLMADNQVRRLPVIDADDQVVGVVSLNDVARHAGGARTNGVDRELATTLAAIGLPRVAVELRNGASQLAVTGP